MAYMPTAHGVIRWTSHDGIEACAIIFKCHQLSAR